MPARKQPNILFVFTDQQRWDTCGCYGSPMGLTPNLDRLAVEGLRFEHAFTNQPLCGPARAIVQTGQYATQTGCHRNGIALPGGQPTLAGQLGAAGYETAYIGKWHLASNDGGGPGENFRTKPVPPQRRGGYADYWLASDVLEFTSHPDGGTLFDNECNPVTFEGVRVDRQTDFAIDYLTTRTNGRPWFLFLSYLEPHHQNDMQRYVAPPGYAERYRDPWVPGDLRGLKGDWAEQLPDYYGAIAALDENLGRLAATLKRTGQLDNTVIVFTSDHGSHFKTRSGVYKRACHDACTRIPLVLWGPKLRVGQTVDELVSLVDLPPTLMELGGAAVPKTAMGRSLLPLIKAGSDISNQAAAWPEDVYIEISESGTGRAVRTRRHTYAIETHDPQADQTGTSATYREAYLYDNLRDPHQQTNLIGDPRYDNAKQDMKRRLLKRIKLVEGKEVEILESKR